MSNAGNNQASAVNIKDMSKKSNQLYDAIQNVRSAETINQGLTGSNGNSSNFPTKSIRQRGMPGLLNKSEMNIKIAEKSSDRSQQQKQSSTQAAAGNKKE